MAAHLTGGMLLAPSLAALPGDTPVLEQAYSTAAPAVARELPAVQALRLILVQQFYWETGPDNGEKVTWRENPVRRKARQGLAGV